MKTKILFFALCCLLLFPKVSFAENLDTDSDGVSDTDEVNIYHTDPKKTDTDSDGYTDGEEIKYGFDPNSKSEIKIPKTITISLKDQLLTYSLGPYVINSFKISSGLRKSTPTGEYNIELKKPKVTYKGAGYYYPNTRWNMLFKYQKVGNLYIHGAYWHNKFGKPASHGCINVAYKDIEALYNWADVGSKVIITN